MRILFCNISWMRWYKGFRYNDRIMGGGKYVTENGDGYEIDNFWPIHNTEAAVILDDGTEIDLPEGDICLGFVETGHRNGESRQLCIERIHECESYKQAAYVEDVLVVFCATAPHETRSWVVGWYHHARVMRYYFEYPLNDIWDSYLWKNIICKAKDAVLLPENLRNWDVPRVARDDKGFGFGQSNVWYADYDKPETEAWVREMYHKIMCYDGPNILYEKPESIYSV